MDARLCFDEPRAVVDHPQLAHPVERQDEVPWVVDGNRSGRGVTGPANSQPPAMRGGEPHRIRHAGLVLR